MTALLPYSFDTSSVAKWILGAVVLMLLIVILPGILYSLLVERSGSAALSLLFTAAVLAYFGRILHQNLEGSRGVITANAVEVEPTHLYGIELKGPAGRFLIEQFKAVRVERATAAIGTQGHGQERIRLIGKDGTPDLLIARTDLDAGKPLAQALAAAVGLPYEEGSALY